jgi:cytochrome P450
MAREVPQCPFHLADAPVGEDRTAGWRQIRKAGDVVEIDGTVYLTSWEAVEQGARHPEVFSSKRAFDNLGSPLPLVPIAIDPPEHVRYRRLLDPSSRRGVSRRWRTVCARVPARSSTHSWAETISTSSRTLPCRFRRRCS